MQQNFFSIFTSSYSTAWKICVLTIYIIFTSLYVLLLLFLWENFISDNQCNEKQHLDILLTLLVFYYTWILKYTYANNPISCSSPVWSWNKWILYITNIDTHSFTEQQNFKKSCCIIQGSFWTINTFLGPNCLPLNLEFSCIHCK